MRRKAHDQIDGAGATTSPAVGGAGDGTRLPHRAAFLAGPAVLLFVRNRELAYHTPFWILLAVVINARVMRPLMFIVPLVLYVVAALTIPPFRRYKVFCGTGWSEP